MTKTHILLAGALLAVLGCGKRYPPPGALSNEMEQAIAEDNITFIQRQFDNKLANPNDTDAVNGMSGLAMAAHNGNMGMVQLYVSAGADVNYIKGDSPSTNPLWQSQIYQSQPYPQIYAYLKTHGARPPAAIRAAFRAENVSQ